MGEPRRIQLSRKRGFNLQAVSQALNGLPAIKVTRPGRWGNPWTFANSGNVHPALRFACETAPLWDVSPLRGKNLACFCALDAECHADVLLELANRSSTETDR